MFCVYLVESLLLFSDMRDGAMASRKVDINTASLEQLESLVGVGHAKAQTIIEARRVSIDLYLILYEI